MSMGPMAVPWRGCATVPCSTGSARPCRCGTLIFPTRSTTSRSGPIYRTTAPSTTGSRCSGSCFSPAPWRARPSRGISPKAPRAFSWRGSRCSRRPRAGASRYPGWIHDRLREMTARIRLPGRPDPLLIPAPSWAGCYSRPASRRVYAAAHVAASPDGAIDWESTMAFREHLWAHGFAVADAMDTAQRGMGLTWDQARELITYSAQRAAARDPGRLDSAPRDPARLDSAPRDPARLDSAPRDPARLDSAPRDPGHSAILACGAGTDQLAAGGTYRLGEIVTAYEEQLDLLQSAGVQ